MTPRKLQNLTFNTLLKKNKPFARDILVESYQNQIEDMGFILADKQALINILQDLTERLTKRGQDLQVTKDLLQMDVERKAETIRNSDYITKAMQARIKVETANTAHLAKKAIVLHQENERLKTELKETKTILEQSARKGFGVTDALHKEVKVLLQLIRSYNDAMTQIFGLPRWSFCGKAKDIARKYHTYVNEELDMNNIHPKELSITPDPKGSGLERI